jgi:hypothetical protein
MLALAGLPWEDLDGRNMAPTLLSAQTVVRTAMISPSL